MPTTEHRTELRREIQGLRAIAALVVVVFHLWPHRLSGGYIGVDIFFVISGFLITAHLLREVEATGRVRLARFWARRARRLLPASLLVISVSAVATWLWVPQSLWPQFFRETIASTLYFENWRLAHDSVNYLAQDNAASPVQHYWTLSTEEQFYLVWPLLVVLAMWFALRGGWSRRRAITAVLGLVTLASLVYSLRLTETNPAVAYFITPTRAWEFGAGALLAALPAVRWRPLVRTVVGSLAIVVLLTCAFVFDHATPMPGTAAIIVVGATVAFLASGRSATWWSPVRLLETRPATLTGDISYALYLWHWPLIILLPYWRDRPNGHLMLWAILVATFALSYLSTKLVEDPIRHQAQLRKRTSLTFVLAAVTALTLVIPSNAVIREVDQQAARDAQIAETVEEAPPRCFGAPARDPERTCANLELETVRIPDPRFARDDNAVGRHCASHGVDEELEPCRFGDWDDPDALRIVVVGDSHARMFNDPLAHLADIRNIAVRVYVQSGCVWTLAEPHNTKFGPECVAFKEKLKDVFAEDIEEYDVVLTTGRVSKLVGSEEQITADLLGAWSWATDAGVPVVAIADIPENDNTLDQCLEAVSVENSAECSIDRETWLRSPDPLVVAAEQGRLTRAIDFTEVLCDDDLCPAVIGGATVYANSNHYTATFARTLAPLLWRELARRPAKFSPSRRLGTLS